MNHQRSGSFLAPSEEEQPNHDSAPSRSRQRRLIDYTVTNGRNEAANAHERIAVLDSAPESQEQKLQLPCLKSSTTPEFEPTICSSSPPPQDSENDMIEFWLRIPLKRTSRTTSSLENIRGLFAKTKNRSKKSPLFGSFSGNGELRRSYTDLRDAFRLYNSEGNATQGSSPRSSAILDPTGSPPVF